VNLICFLISVLVQALGEPCLTLKFVKSVFRFLDPMAISLANLLGRRAHHVSHILDADTRSQPFSNPVVAESVGVIFTPDCR
jgi:hypothetical protein